MAGNQDLAGKVVLVTGASRGIGYAAAIEAAKRGAHVVAVARTVGGLEELDDEIVLVAGSCWRFHQQTNSAAEGTMVANRARRAASGAIVLRCVREASACAAATSRGAVALSSWRERAAGAAAAAAAGGRFGG